MNETIRDKRMSFRATGLLVFLLSLPGDWKANQQHIATCKKEKRDAVITAWNELRELGYISKEITREKGRITGTIWNIYESPQPLTDFPETAQPETAQPLPVNPPLRSTEDNEKTKEKKNTPKGANGASSFETKRYGFEEFYAAYPNKQKKAVALKAWESAKNKCAEHFEEISLALEIQKTWTTWNKQDGRFIPHPATWLNGHCWLDEERKTPAKPEPVKSDRAF